MNDKELCPICNQPLTTKAFYNHDIHMVEEEHKECDNCKNYSYEFSFGATRITIGEKEFIYSNYTSSTNRHLISEGIYVEILRLKKEFNYDKT